jgi:penicillin-binding protein 1B
MTRRNSKTKGKSRKAPTKTRRWWPRVAAFLFLGGTVIFGTWCLWIDHQVRRDFSALQWALPARIYARPLELYVGAHLGLEDLGDYLQRLGYRQSAQVAGPGEYQVSGSRIRLRTRGFDFWDSPEPSVYAEVDFTGRGISALRGEPAVGPLSLARLEPVEIAQINPETGEDRLPVALKDVPQDLIEAVIAVEDQRFYSHYGVDPIGIARALWTNLRRGEVVQGGSTLTQQLVKNLYLGRERTLRRKLEEAVMAVALDYHFTKDDILTAYLNEVFLGQDGNRAIHGFALAAEYYFGRPLKELRLEELAVLAGLPRGASYYNPLRYPERAVERRNVVLARMEDQGYITERQSDHARAAELVVSARPVKRGAGYPAFMELVYKDLRRDYDAEALRTEGLHIFTTLDIGMQNRMEALLDQSVATVQRPVSGAAPLEAAVVITDASTGEVRAVAGSRKAGYTGFNRALNAVRPIGSLVKPAVYLAALESRDFHLASVLADEPVVLNAGNGQIWEPKNYENTTEGDVYLYDALQRSLNLATVDLGMKLGVDKVAAMLKRLGLDRDVRPYPSLLLGAVEMAPIEVAQLYQTLASNGFRSPLRAVDAVTTAQGAPLAWYGIQTEQVADPAAVYLLEYALQGVFERGTARTAASRLGANLPLAGKTGTTNDLRDSWFAGYGNDLVGVVWLGHDDNRETGLTGATGALRVWTDIMSALDIQPRQTTAPANIEWESVAHNATRNPARRDCSETLSLPFSADRMQDLAYSCEVNDSFFERLIERIRSEEQ